MPEAEIESLRRIYTAIQQQDNDALQQAVTHDTEWHLPEGLPWGGTHHGHLGILAVAESFQEQIDGIWADPEEFLECDDDLILVLGRLMGRGRQTGQSFEVPFAHVWGLSDGMPSSFRGYYDSAPITAVLGSPARD